VQGTLRRHGGCCCLQDAGKRRVLRRRVRAIRFIMIARVDTGRQRSGATSQQQARGRTRIVAGAWPLARIGGVCLLNAVKAVP